VVVSVAVDEKVKIHETAAFTINSRRHGKRIKVYLVVCVFVLLI
jgi:hypothetical protein